MDFLRAVDFAAYDQHAYGAQFLYVCESAIVIGSNVPAGAPAPSHHVHAVDQVYYVVTGEMHVQLGRDTHVVGPETLVYIPAGTPHHNWNEGDVSEFHFEALAPSPPRNQLLLLSLPDQTPRDGKPYRIVPLSAGEPTSRGTGFVTQKLLSRNDGSDHMALYIATVEPGGAGPPAHVHTFDQFFYVLDGMMTVQIGLDRHVAGPHTLVVLPAGVPHAQWNEGPDVERHVALLAPEPELGSQSGTRRITLTATDPIDLREIDG
jgi:mannose-6-phosphate isomerase-like protein (cupin superfamily)